VKRPIRGARAILFDLDGTLVDSRRDIAAACNFALAAVGRPPSPVDVIAAYVGDGARMLVARALEEAPGDAMVTHALAAFQAYYAEHAAVYTTWMPGAREAAIAFSDRPLGLVTNKPRVAALAVLDALSARGLFEAIVAGEDAPLKPDPRGVLAALAGLQAPVSPAEAWVVGDGPQDVLAGRAAGCVTVGVRGGFASDERLEAAAPDVVLDSMHELVPLVRGLEQGGAASDHARR
jgi:2-phosphoglycolate phosphatase